jgi:hypothetical protein
MGENTWLRLTERWTATAKSVFLFDVQGEVATSTHAGLPWLLYLREKCRRPSHFWPFDGWEVPQGKSVVAEVYPSLWTRRFPRDDRDGDEQAAYAAAAWLQRADRNGSLGSYFSRPLSPEERGVAAVEGWRRRFQMYQKRLNSALNTVKPLPAVRIVTRSRRSELLAQYGHIADTR